MPNYQIFNENLITFMKMKYFRNISHIFFTERGGITFLLGKTVLKCRWDKSYEGNEMVVYFYHFFQEDRYLCHVIQTDNQIMHHSYW